MKSQVPNIPSLFFGLMVVAIFISSCGSFQPVAHYDDGIYGDTPIASSNNKNYADQGYYKKYFSDKAQEYAQEENQDAIGKNDVLVDTLITNSQDHRSYDNININYYGYGSHGFYNRYDNYWDYHYRPWRNHRYRSWHSWSYHHEPYHYGWSYYSPYYSFYPYYNYHYNYNPYYGNYGSGYYQNPKNKVKASGRRGAPVGNSQPRNGTTYERSGRNNYSTSRTTSAGKTNTIDSNVGRRFVRDQTTNSGVKNEVQGRDSSDFMTRDYSSGRNYRDGNRSSSTPKTNSYSRSNNSYNTRQSKSNNYNSSNRSSSRNYSNSSNKSSNSRSSSGSRSSSSRSSSSGRR